MGLLALLATASQANAEQVYVIEQLVVAVVSEPEGAGDKVGQVKSGDRLELLERQGDEAHVRLANGKDGWIKGSYVTTDQPLTNRLNERTAEIDKLKQDVARLQTELAAARVAAARPTPPAAPTPAPNINSSAEAPATVSETAGAVFLRSPELAADTSWGWVLGSGAVMLLVGFALGWRTLDKRIRRKYGGLRIY